MTLNPTLKSILVRTAYIVGSLTIYYIAYNYCLDYLDFHYWSDGGLIDGHPTLRYTLLMMAAAILIWVNIRKLSRPNIRLYFSAFLLGLGQSVHFISTPNMYFCAIYIWKYSFILDGLAY